MRAPVVFETLQVIPSTAKVDHCHRGSLGYGLTNSHVANISCTCYLYCIRLLEMWWQLLPVAHFKEISMWSLHKLLCAFEIWDA